MYEQIADILIPYGGAAIAALLVVILLITVVNRVGRGNRERKQQLEELNGSIREIRDTLQAMQTEPEPEGGNPPPEPAKTVVRIDNRVQVVESDYRMNGVPVISTEEPDAALAETTNEPEPAEAESAELESAEAEPTGTESVEPVEAADLTAGFRENFERTPDEVQDEMPEEGLETVEQILAEAAFEDDLGTMPAETEAPMASRVKIPVPEQPLPASLCASTTPAEEGPKMPKYMDRHQGTDKNGHTFTAEELRKQIR